MHRSILVFIVFSIIVYVESYRFHHTRRQNDNTTDIASKPNSKDRRELKSNNARKNTNYNKSGRKLAYRAENSDTIGSPQRSFNSYNTKQNSDSKPDNSLEKVVLSLNSGIKKILQQNNIQPNFLDGYADQVINFFKTKAAPMYRAVESKYNIKPEIVHFRSDKPTLKFEINAKTMTALLKDFLKSETFNENLDSIVKQAGMIFRTIQDGGMLDKYIKKN